MKIVMGVDMEGITGVCHPDMVMHVGKFGEEGLELAVGDINAAVQGLVEAGVDDIIVWDNHWRGLNEPLPKLHPAARYCRGGGSNGLRWATLDKDTDGVILLGYHAKAGTLHAVLEHTMSSESWFRLKVNGREIGEIGIDGALTGGMGVPVLMVSGDDKLCAEATDLFGKDLVAVCVKQGLGRHGAICLPPAATSKLIRTGAAEAVRRLGKVKPLDLGSPAVVELTFKHTHQADHADLRMFKGRRLDGYTVQWTCRNFTEWMGFTTKNPPPTGPA
jgi:D-amino peptidase